MKKSLFVFLAAIILLSACASPTATPTATESLEPEMIAYQIVGSTKNTFMVVVDPESNTDREGLQRLGDYLCRELANCWVYFWDDINKADTSYPVDPDKKQTLIASYSFKFVESEGVLKVYTLGDER